MAQRMLPCSLPAPASRLSRSWTTADGKLLRLRPVCPGDSALAVQFVESLSYGARYFRFGCGDFHLDELQARYLCSPNWAECADFVIVVVADGVEQEIASGRYCIDGAGHGCEFALAVVDAWQGRGLGLQMMHALIDCAIQSGLKHMYGRVLASNARMIAFSRRMGFVVKPMNEAQAICRVELALVSGDPACAAGGCRILPARERCTPPGR